MSSTLAEYLKTTDVEATLIHCDTTTPTVERAAAALGVPASAIVKSIVLEYKQAPPGVCLVIVPGDRRVSRVKVAAALAVDRLRLASAEVVKEATGYWPGGVPPIGHHQPLEVVIDRRVFDHDVVYGGGGHCCMNTRCGWGGVARTSRDPPQEPHYGDEVEGPSQVQDEVPRCELAGL